MAKLKNNRDAVREIIDDFAREIKRKRVRGAKPEKTVIDFRNERRNNVERDIFELPIDLLLYRKDNGRISSDVASYEKTHGRLDEKTEKAQEMLYKFLKEKDPDKTEELTQSIKHAGQIEPAIITCDGFLINGNRRKMVLQTLAKSEGKFGTIKAVILPGKKDKNEGGPPTLLEIEQIENRYQLQSEGKAEYYAFDRAISMRRKIQLGMTIIDQLKDDPVYAGRGQNRLEKQAKEIEAEDIEPLNCIDRYLHALESPGLYERISTGRGDPEGRWQAFFDYSKSVHKICCDEKRRLKYGIKEDEVGKIEDVAFKIIRQRELAELPKAHKIMRDLLKWLGNEDSKKELFKLGKEIDHG